MMMQLALVVLLKRILQLADAAGKNHPVLARKGLSEMAAVEPVAP
jgi:hypothetical protein